jgi:hypothetical protein
MHAKNNILTSRYWYALAALSVIGYLITACWLTDNTPKFDDLNDVFGFFKQLALDTHAAMTKTWRVFLSQ